MVKITYQVPKGSGFRKFVLLMIVAVAMMGMVGSVNGDVTIAPILSSDLLVSNLLKILMLIMILLSMGLIILLPGAIL